MSLLKMNTVGCFCLKRMNIGINAFYQPIEECSNRLPLSGLFFGRTMYASLFLQKDTYISHTAKSKDHSKFTVRFISRAGLGFDEAHIKKIFNNTQCIFK